MRSKEVKPSPAELEVRRLVHRLTRSKRTDELDAENLKKLKQICRGNDEAVSDVWDHLWKKSLRAKNSNVRYLSLLLCAYLFDRSGCFRRCVLCHLAPFLEKVAGTSLKDPLPPPIPLTLRRKSIEVFLLWKEKFPNEKALEVAYAVLKRNPNIGLEEVERGLLEERERSAQSRAAEERGRELRLRQMVEEYQNTKQEIESNLMAIENCFSLLISAPDSFSLSLEDELDCSPPSKRACPSGEAKVIPTETKDKATEVQVTTCEMKGNPNETRVNPSEAKATATKVEDSSSEAKDKVDMRGHGIVLPNARHSFQIRLNPVLRNREIEVDSEADPALVENVQDLALMLENRFRALLYKWAFGFEKFGGSSEQKESVKSLTQKVDKALDKYRDLKLPPRRPKKGGEQEEEGDTSSDESGFMTVV